MQGNVSEMVRESWSTGFRGDGSGAACAKGACPAAVHTAIRNAAGQKPGITGCQISPARVREVRA